MKPIELTPDIAAEYVGGMLGWTDLDSDVSYRCKIAACTVQEEDTRLWVATKKLAMRTGLSKKWVVVSDPEEILRHVNSKWYHDSLKLQDGMFVYTTYLPVYRIRQDENGGNIHLDADICPQHVRLIPPNGGMPD